MKNWRSDNLNQSAFEKTGAIPRSITRTFEKFKKELDPNAESEIIEEFRVSRYQTSASIKYLLLLLLSPILVNQLSKNFVFSPFIDYFWKSKDIKTVKGEEMIKLLRAMHLPAKDGKCNGSVEGLSENAKAVLAKACDDESWKKGASELGFIAR